MGQNTSRYRSPDSHSHPETPSSTTNSQASEALQGDSVPREGESYGAATSPATKRTRRQSIQRTIMKLSSPKSIGAGRQRTESAVSSTQASRKWWRMSRRMSKSPDELNRLTPETPLDVTPTVAAIASENAEAASSQSLSSIVDKGKEKEKEPIVEDVIDIAESQASQHVSPPPSYQPAESSFSTEHLDAPSRRSEEIGESGLVDDPSESKPESSRAQALPFNAKNDDEVVVRPSIESRDTTADAVTAEDWSSYREPEHQETETSIPSSSPPSNPAPGTDNVHTHQGRQFPPPGTLVVVQGVVHTTDVSRTGMNANANVNSRSSPRASSVPPLGSQRSFLAPPTPSSERSSMRNRLSAIIPRPSSMLSSIPSSASAGDIPSSATSLGTESSDASSRAESDTTETSPPGSAPVSANADRSGPAADNNSSPGSLSPSSIDVLGTLLSVAAAATAASLLTGSSEPIFSSGLAPPSPGNSDPHSPTQGPLNSSDRPTSPTPTAGLGGLGSFSGLGLGGNEHASGQGQNSRDRMRHVWGSLRDRLGLRGAGLPGSRNGESDLGTRTRPDGTPMDAREIMLAEMARAFNLGLGISNGAGNTPPQTNTPGSTVNPTTTSSLSGGSPGSEAPQTETIAPSLPPPDSFERFLIDLQADLRVALTRGTDPNPSPPAQAENSPSARSQRQSEEESPVTTNGTTEDHVTDELAGDRPPPLADVSDSEDEGEEVEVGEDTNLEGSRGQHDANLDAGANVIPDLAPGSTSRTEHTPGGGINWWRMFRFPPITSPQGQGIGLQNGGIPLFSPMASAQTSGTFPQSHSAAPTAATPSATGETAAHPNTNENRSNTVVPVIVVGLQSVNMDQRGEHDHAHAPEDDGPDGNHDENGHMDFDDFENMPENMRENSGDSPTPRGRSWQSRAANAFRNLRPGRRGAAQAQATDAPGSRTFLIYVIGGYYPPDHHIITGAGNLDSFEALWELAELLGQVKPPTVTKEEIDRSGLEVIKASLLQQYEKDNKVASNCVDRCLICLDDYRPEEDLRVLVCRHAFHKGCVDKWLQTGRNNCPACRSKGVGSETGTSGPNVSPHAPATA